MGWGDNDLYTISSALWYHHNLIEVFHIETFQKTSELRRASLMYAYKIWLYYWNFSIHWWINFSVPLNVFHEHKNGWLPSFFLFSLLFFSWVITLVNFIIIHVVNEATMTFHRFLCINWCFQCFKLTQHYLFLMNQTLSRFLSCILIRDQQSQFNHKNNIYSPFLLDMLHVSCFSSSQVPRGDH